VHRTTRRKLRGRLYSSVEDGVAQLDRAPRLRHAVMKFTTQQRMGIEAAGSSPATVAYKVQPELRLKQSKRLSAFLNRSQRTNTGEKVAE
jgi:hypothetical protein